MTYDEWFSQYQPYRNHIDRDGGYRYETDGADMKYIEGMAKEHPGRIWTQVETDHGLVISNGLHTGNRHAFYVAKMPYKGPDIEIKVADNK